MKVNWRHPSLRKDLDWEEKIKLCSWWLCKAPLVLWIYVYSNPWLDQVISKVLETVDKSLILRQGLCSAGLHQFSCTDCENTEMLHIGWSTEMSFCWNFKSPNDMAQWQWCQHVAGPQAAPGHTRAEAKAAVGLCRVSNHCQEWSGPRHKVYGPGPVAAAPIQVFPGPYKAALHILFLC